MPQPAGQPGARHRSLRDIPLPRVAPTPLAHRIESPVGRLTLVADDDGALCGLYVGDDIRADGPWPLDAGPFREAVEQLDEYFGGERQEFDLPLRLEGTRFQRAVWSALLDVPFGSTTTYTELAAAAGRPSAVRAAGAANGRNPLSILVPCHRVLGRDGRLRGYAGGESAKALLLEHERLAPLQR